MSAKLLRRSAPRLRLRAATFLLATSAALVPVTPLLWIIFTALKNPGRVVENPLGPPPGRWYWENFAGAWEGGHFGTYFANSIVVAVPTVLAVLVLSLLAAYPFAIMTFRFKKLLFSLFLVGLTVPVSVLIIPLFYEINAFDLLDTPWALILPQIAIQVPFGILLLTGFIKELPHEILDAGRIDGCDHIQMIWHIITPMTWPALLTLLVFVFMWTWNQFLLPLVLIQKASSRTLPLGLLFFQGRYVSNIPLLMAGATISFLPIIIIYLVFQRHFIRGISAGAFRLIAKGTHKKGTGSDADCHPRSELQTPP